MVNFAGLSSLRGWRGVVGESPLDPLATLRCDDLQPPKPQQEIIRVLNMNTAAEYLPHVTRIELEPTSTSWAPLR